jgi:hypothetical protein
MVEGYMAQGSDKGRKQKQIADPDRDAAVDKE